MRRIVYIAVAGVSLVVLATPARAHVTVQPTEAPVGSFSRFVVRVPNERDNASTTKVEVQLPPLAFVSFQDKEGWRRDVKMVALDQRLEVFGDEITEVPGTVTWSGGKVQPHEFEEFGFSARVPEEVTTLKFPAIQTYDSGETVLWIGPADAEQPAAFVKSLDVGAQEGQGELGVIADLRKEVERLRTDVSEGSHDDRATLLASVGIALGAIALVAALVRRT